MGRLAHVRLAARARHGCDRLAIVAVLTLVAPGVALAQARGRDSVRTIIIDSVQKTYGESGSSPRSAASGDLSRTVDAEVRVAMFELASGETLPAMSRLERIASLIDADSASVGAPERSALHFLLSQSYYRLGMTAGFRREAEAALRAGQTRYAAILAPQLMVDAYRAGDYARADSVARTLPAADANGIGTLVRGLAAYQTGDLATARAAFGRAASGPGPLATYAKYMDALAQLRADTAAAAGSVATLESVATSATGPFADQVRLTAAQVAYEAQRYDDAIRIASPIPESSHLAASALLTRAWALYKLDRVDDAERAFSDFATRYANRPEAEEAQLMAAQTQLELGRSTDAERVFQRVADSAAFDVGRLQAETNAAIAAVSRSLVADRAIAVLAMGDPSTTKSLVVRDSAGADALVALGDGSVPVVSGTVAVTAGGVATRLDSIARTTSPLVRRVLYSPASATARPRELANSSERLTTADATVSVARYRLGEQVEAQHREMALLARLGAMLASDSGSITVLAANYQTLADSMAKLDQLMAVAEARLREMLAREIEATKSLAAENVRTADSLRTALAAGASPDDQAALDAEVASATAYNHIAELASTGLDRAIAHHPAFVMRDSLRTHNATARAALAQLQTGYSTSRRDIDAVLGELRSGDAPYVQRARQALADAESRRAAAENEVIAAVSAELSARAEELVASLERNTEAAQFGVASAAFFRAIDGTRAIGRAGAVGTARTGAPQRRR